ncbi:MAG: type II and III secretion system protein family protein [Thermohalobaculum sp.]|nr:type II and III secretion system protein family protein [Thermohalobaculum sp.]
MLRVARGLASDNISVLVNRAVVVETSQPFVEVSVAQPEIADVSPLSDRAIYVLGRGRGVTTLTLLGENGALIANVTVSVMPDLAELKERLRAVMPREPIEVRSAGGGIILSGIVSGKAKIDRAMSLARAYTGAEVTNMMSVGGTQQVSLKVKIAEMSRSASKELGFNVGARGVTNRTGSLVNAPTGTSVSPEAGQGTGILAPAALAASGFGTFGAIFAIADSFLLDITITALEDKGFARLLAEPNLVALSGAQATFLAGGEVAIPTINGDGEANVEFKPIGVALNFIPTVLDDDLINISVAAEVSAIDTTSASTLVSVVGGTPISIPNFTIRRANTMVELKDGQSFAIAGLLQDDFNDSVNQIPWLGDVPVLGTLFRSTDFQRSESELVIIVTANLVVPVDSIEQLELPTDRVALPNEFDLFLMGRPSNEHGGASATQGLDGAFGYVVE